MEASCSQFTAAEGGARLAVAAASKNILAVEYASFIPLRLLYEKAYQIRGSLFDGRKRSAYVTRASRVEVVAYELRILTDLAITQATKPEDVYDWCAELDSKEVIVCTSAVLRHILSEKALSMTSINVLVLDSCHLVYEDDHLKYIMKQYNQCEPTERPIILALTYPLFTSNKKDNDEPKNTQTDDQTNSEEEKDNTKDSVAQEKDTESKEIVLVEDVKKTEKTNAFRKKKEMESEQVAMGAYENLDDFDLYEKLEWKIEDLERELCCQMDLAEDIDGGKRLSASITKPRELIIEYSGRPTDDTLSEEYIDLERFMKDTVDEAINFINDHRHDPTEIYGDELYEEFMNIPEPTIDPKMVFKHFLYILEQLGPYAADKAAFSLLTKLEKLKIKTPYERHFLLLCLCTTVFVKIRCYADLVFSKYESDWEKIQRFCTSKVLRFAEILEKFRPPDLPTIEAKNNNALYENKADKNNDTENIDASRRIDTISEENNTVDNREPNKIDITRMLNEIENCDFTTLGDKIQDKVNTIIADLKDIDDGFVDSSLVSPTSNNDTDKSTEQGTTSNTDDNEQQMNNTETSDGNELNDVLNPTNVAASKNGAIDAENGVDVDVKTDGIQDITSNDVVVKRVSAEKTNSGLKSVLPFPRRTGRVRGRIRVQRSNAARVQQMQQNPDALCGIVYMKEALMAKILFMLIVDMSRCNRKLSYLCAQYCATEQPADPATEPKECQRQGKKQEEVLKKFRMHECNLLLATSALEEGIDLPRCNLVLRWDVPPSYRSYGVCRGRARAARAAAALLCSHSVNTTDALLHNLAIYRELDQIISRKCGCGIQDEPPQSEEDKADMFTAIVKPYTPSDDGKPKNDGVVAQKANKPEAHTKNKVIDTNGPKSNDKDVNYLKPTDTHKENDKREVLNNDISYTNDTVDIVVVNDYDNSDIIPKVANNSLENVKDKLISGIHEKIDVISGVMNDLALGANEKCYNEALHDSNFKSELQSNTDQSVNIKDSLKINDKVKDTIVDDKLDAVKTEEIPTGVVENFNDFEHELNLLNNDPNKLDIPTEINNFVAKENISETNFDKNHKVIESNAHKTSESLSDVSQNDINIKDNAYCNKCNSVKNSGIECPCVSVKCNNDDKSEKESVNKCDSKKNLSDASVDLSTAIALINRYCGKLPSDTFTRLAPQYWMEEVQLPVPGSHETRTAYICTLRLPLNCPVKYNIVGHPMATKVLARRMVALQACRILHKSGELDDQLMPIGKENFKAVELEASGGMALCAPGDSDDPGDPARPGTTKRRQYYFKRTAYPFTDCEPVVDTSDSELGPSDTPRHVPGPGTPGPERIDGETSPKPKTTGGKRNMLYAIVSKLWCALPERYNTRGRRLHAPQHARQAIGILMARDEPDNLQIPAFPVYTRSGEVRVSVEYVPDADVRVTPRRATRIRRFMRFVFAEVLRVRRRGMRLHGDAGAHNNYYVVPTVKSTREDGSTKIDVDWSFLELIYQHTEDMKQSEIEKPMVWRNDEENGEDPHATEKSGDGTEKKEVKVKKMDNPLLKPGETFVFDPEKYREAVVTPWYRNQDQPQFFLVAEICWNLTPDSAFPSATHTTFREYYSTKYGVTLTQRDQPLLDVDHTSARLNLLTPRYVNRKGVALPVSSERTRRAKRDRLDQKQILLPELCRLHPFAAPLWFATVALPCVLYRINALLIADEIRRAVAIEVGLGIPKISEQTLPGFQWPPLDFGWSLAEVLSADSEKNEKKKEEDESKKEPSEMEKKVQEESEIPQNGEAGAKEDEKKEKTINDLLQEKEDAESGFEIGTWSNDMASSIPQEMEYDEFMEPLPPNLTFCTSASGGANWCDPIEKPKSQFNPGRAFSVADSDCSYMSSDLDSDDTDLDYEDSDDDTDTSGFCSSKNTNAAMGVRIEYRTAREAEAVDVSRARRARPAPAPHAADDAADRHTQRRLLRAGTAPSQYIDKFRASVARHKQDFIDKGHLIPQDRPVTDVLPATRDNTAKQGQLTSPTQSVLAELFPYGHEKLTIENGQIDIKSIEQNKRYLLAKLKNSMTKDRVKKLNCFSMVDIDIDSPSYVNEKVANVGFDKRERYEGGGETGAFYVQRGKGEKGEFEFDHQPELRGHPGPSPSVILQALTMSNANDGINLERLETIGDSFLKFAITAYLYCAHPTVHEGKLSHMRSKQVSNLNLYRLGRSKRLGARMTASKFEPHDNWLPPCHRPPHTQRRAHSVDGQESNPASAEPPLDATGCFIPYNLITQHSIPDKSIADCVEALIGAYLLECGPRGALLFMSWLGIRVLPCHLVALPHDHPYVVGVASRENNQKPPPSPTLKRHRASSSSSDCSSEDEESSQEQMSPVEDWSWPGRPVGSLRPYRDEHGKWMQPIFGELKAPPSPLLRYIDDPEGELEQMLSGYDALERTLQYRFRDRSLLLQALTHASHHSNRLTDCYQRLEFLGDAILDYLITRHLYEDPRRHSPGALTDLRSALVNNTIFATLAARHGFHKYFRHMSPGLNEVLTKYVKIQEENGHSISEEHYLIQEDEMEQAEDVEVPKALGDLFESVAGAIFLDSGMSLDAVWRSYVNLMGAELEAFSAAAPKSPVRELLEAEPDTAKFGKPERLADGRRVRVCVEVFGRGAFKGVGRNYRIAKGTAARCALRHLRARRNR